ncbi:hypothetical protein BB560_000403 [Smittium megazygosporum]|uniref:Exonuclease domain-containing protein n=1 Tax=Smittium megazygosporum TaxID=133381 RepID=A0A2T9ZKK1_9FUNG|nr:hypothetical protein BB560_006179 [Smittium megazygosporum]PVV05080.1 hypothetical protein BB560_000403 [Smittium megazygosporum]
MNKGTLLWIDCEMTGLDVNVDKILEISTIITDDELNVIGPKLNFVIHQSQAVLDNMNEWCVEHHTQSGLVEQVLASKTKLKQAEADIIRHINKYALTTRKLLLAGNSVHCDLVFIKKYLPRITKKIGHRIIDVSTIKELAFRWLPEVASAAPKKKLNHRSLDDIVESIEELRYYKEKIFMGKISST